MDLSIGGAVLFSHFDEKYLDVDGVRLFVRCSRNTESPPLVLLHGYPQTSAMWHKVAPLLVSDYHVICPDLRGYGRSDKPPSSPDHSTYSKRAMANDIVKMMNSLGYNRFYVGAHDRGARVAHRLGMDHPQSVIAMTLLDIAPTREMYKFTTAEFSMAYWHWFFLIQKHPLPEKLIGNDPIAFWKLKCFNQAGRNDIFAESALHEYLNAFDDPLAIHASCEDYRAAYSIDIEHDNEDGRRLLSVPINVIWAKHGVIEKCFDPIELWKLRAIDVSGHAIDATHYMAEEKPALIADHFRAFFS